MNLSPMDALLDDLLAKNPDGFSVQISTGGQSLSGAIRRTPHGGVYEMAVVSVNPQTGQAMPLSVFVAGSTISTLIPVTDDLAQLVERKRDSGLVLPRRS